MKQLLLIPIFTITLNSFGQSLSNEVIGTTGDFYNGTSSSLSWTLGEVMVSSYESSGIMLTQGFHQTYISQNSSSINENGLFEVNVFPNPTSSITNISIKDASEVFTIELYSLEGKLLFNDSFSGGFIYSLDLLPFERGMYFIKLTGKSTGRNSSIKIQKS